jgi:hypothetical protein
MLAAFARPEEDTECVSRPEPAPARRPAFVDENNGGWPRRGMVHEHRLILGALAIAVARRLGGARDVAN